MGTKTRALNREEFAAYIKEVINAPESEAAVSAVCCLVIGTGARIGEVLAMTESDLFDALGNPLPRVTRTLEKKRGTGQRKTVDFPWEELGEPIKRWRIIAKRRFCIHRKKPFFSMRYSGNPISQRYCRRVNARFLSRAVIDPHSVAFHGIRKSFLSCAYYQRIKENGGDLLGSLRYVQDLAGHGSFETTLRYLSDCINRPHIETVRSFLGDLREASPDTESAN